MEGTARIDIQRGAAAILPEVLSTAGELEVRLARGPEDVLAAQRLRYRVFYEEMAAVPTPQMLAARRDFDAYDEICDILLVVDPGRHDGDSVVGTYRLLRQDVAMRHGGFYSSSEYDLSPLLAQRRSVGVLFPALRWLGVMAVLIEARQQIVEGHERLGTPCAELHQRRVDDDAVQPRRQARLAAERVQRAPRRQEALLHGVAGVLVAAEHAARRAGTEPMTLG